MTDEEWRKALQQDADAFKRLTSIDLTEEQQKVIREIALKLGTSEENIFPMYLRYKISVLEEFINKLP